MKSKSDYINQFMIVFSASAGLIVGGGSLFIGFIKAQFSVIVLSFIAVMMGVFATLILFRKEEDEYEKIISEGN